TWPSQQAVYFIRRYTELNSEAVLRLVQCILQMRNLGFGLAHQSFGLTHIKLIRLARFELRLSQLVTLPLRLRVPCRHPNSFFESANVDITGRHIRNEGDERVIIGGDGAKKCRAIRFNGPSILAPKIDLPRGRKQHLVDDVVWSQSCWDECALWRA